MATKTINKNKIGINKLTDLPMPLITPYPTIMQVVIINTECQKISFKGDAAKFEKYSVE